MKKEELRHWVVSLVLALVTTVGVEFPGDNIFRRSDLRWRSLQPYETSIEALSGVVLENRGNATSFDIIVRLSTGSETILDLSERGFIGTPVLVEGGRNSSYAVYDVSRLSPSSSGTVYVKTKSPVTVTVECEDENGLGRAADSPPRRSLFERVFRACGTFSLSYLLVSAVAQKIAHMLRQKQQETA